MTEKSERNYEENSQNGMMLEQGSYLRATRK
jgi:hypothetical protein